MKSHYRFCSERKSFDKTTKHERIFSPPQSISYGKALVCLYINICACLSQWWCPVIHNSFVRRELPRHVYIKTIKTQKGHGRERCNWNGDYISSSWRCALEIFKWKAYLDGYVFIVISNFLQFIILSLWADVLTTLSECWLSRGRQQRADNVRNEKIFGNSFKSSVKAL